jgi:predicted nucleic acid-binding protein
VALVDSNVLLDLLTDDPNWALWSERQLETESLRSQLFINDVIYAELSVRFERIEDLDAVLEEAGISIRPIPREALFLAGKAFLNYRQSGGGKSGVLPDFFIGAHAAVLGERLLTRDQSRFGTYFPTVTLVTPNA